MSNPMSPENGPVLPLRPALKETDSDTRSPKGGPAKVVSIAEGEEEIPPLPLSEEASRPKIFTASTAGKRLTGRPTMSGASSSRVSLRSQSSLDDLRNTDLPPVAATAERSSRQHVVHQHTSHPHPQAHPHRHDRFVAQVTEWLQAERAKHAAKKSKRRGKHSAAAADEEGSTSRSRRSSQGSDAEGISLEKLQKILENNMNNFGPEQLPESSASSTPHRSSHTQLGSKRRSSLLLKKLGATSDTDLQDGETIVPSCDVSLDNSKTMSYAGGDKEDPNVVSQSKKADKEKVAWSVFKNEILKLAHTLRLKGWRGIALENSDEIEVKRLSGALTNAVYVVSPPKNHKPSDTRSTPPASEPGTPGTPGTPTKRPHRTPEKVLLRIYGPQVEHLIDRETELSILRRLARQKIGPRLLGTFKNGRFEQFFNAETLTPEDIRDQATSKQIAKRMRELHEGIELLEDERNAGPFVWMNWNKWIDQCEQVMTYLDKEIESGNPGNGEAWRQKGYVCGVKWPIFKGMVQRYEKWLDESYGKNGIKNELVFAHNDTQYGNILRLIPDKPKGKSSDTTSTTLENTAENTPKTDDKHRQLIVIDFEYASANTPGCEFANHFTEWCYNYHDEKKSWACNTENYPTIAQQEAFVRSYINHRPQFNARASSTPRMRPMDSSESKESPSLISLPESYTAEDKSREEATEAKVKEILKQVKLWRVANSVQWTAWGIVQAQIPELENKEGEVVGEKAAREIAEKDAEVEKAEIEKEAEKQGVTVEEVTQGKKQQEEQEKEEGGEEEEEEEFDYLSYAQDRALFFWGDIVSLGLMEKKDLPDGLAERLKFVEG